MLAQANPQRTVFPVFKSGRLAHFRPMPRWKAPPIVMMA